MRTLAGLAAIKPELQVGSRTVPSPTENITNSHRDVTETTMYARTLL